MVKRVIRSILRWFKPPEVLPPPDRSVKRETQLADEIIRNYYRNRRIR